MYVCVCGKVWRCAGDACVVSTKCACTGCTHTSRGAREAGQPTGTTALLVRRRWLGLSLSVCACVCICVRMHVRVRESVHARVCTRACVCACVRMCARMHVRASVCARQSSRFPHHASHHSYARAAGVDAILAPTTLHRSPRSRPVGRKPPIA